LKPVMESALSTTSKGKLLVWAWVLESKIPEN
jgi:hypothetical protein